MTPGKNNRKIKNLLINFSVQHRVIVVNLLFMVLVLILTMAIVYTHLSEKESGTEGLWNLPMGQVTMAISPRLIILYALLLLTFLLSIITQLWMTHRVCGPLVNFCNTFRKISYGDFYYRINLRKDDLLHKEADRFNEMVAGISELVSELKTENERLNLAIEEAVGRKQL